MARQLSTARLENKVLLSDPAQCYHLEFSVPELGAFPFKPGQFVSAVATDAAGKQQTRAYSIASAPRDNRFDLCVNRVEGGFFSNLLCDLEPGQTVQFHGPHGLFTLREPLTDCIFIATGTGIAPMRGFAQHLFPESGECCRDRQVWLVYGTRYETEMYYQDYFEKLAEKHPNFHYLCSLSRAQEGWAGLRGYVQDHVAEILKGRSNGFHGALPPTAEPANFDIHAYICGLNSMVSANRDRLVEAGWHKKQVVFERYD